MSSQSDEKYQRSENLDFDPQKVKSYYVHRKPHPLEEAPGQVETPYQRLTNKIRAIVFELSPQGETLMVNEAVTPLTGYRPDELEGNNWWEMLTTEADHYLVEELNRHFAVGDVNNFHLPLRAKDGFPLIIDLHSANHYKPDGSLEKIVCLGIDISQGQRTQQQLLESQKALAKAQQIARLGSWTWDIPSDTFTWSEELNRLYGMSTTHFNASYHGFLECIHPEDRSLVENQIQKSLENSHPLLVEHRVLHSGDSQRVIQIRGEVILGSDGKPIRLVGTSQDITERVDTELALRQSEERFRIMIENVRDYAIFTLDAEGHVRTWNKGAEGIKQYLSSEIIGKHFSYFYPEEAVQKGIPDKALEKAVAEGRYEEEGWRVKKDGSKFWASVVVTAVRLPDGKLQGFTKVVRDISRRKATEDAFHRQSEFVRLLKEIVTAANEAPGFKHVAQYAIDSICEHTGWEIGHSFIQMAGDLGDMISARIWYLKNPEQYQNFKEVSEQLQMVRGKGPLGKAAALGLPIWIPDISKEEDYLRAEAARNAGLKSGISAPIMTGKRVIGLLEFYSCQEQPQDPELLDVIRNIGTQLGRVVEREQSRDALRKSEARFRAIFNDAPLGIELVNMDGRLIDFNPALARLTGYSMHELRQDALGERDHPANLIANSELFKEMQAGKRDFFLIEKPYLRADHRLNWGRLLVSILRDTNGEPMFAIGMLEDITDRRQMEAELDEMSRRLMEGQELERLHLAQELHDGPMQELYGLSYSLQAYVSGLEERNDSLEEIQSSLHHVVRALRATCGELRPPALAPFGLEKAIRSHVEAFSEIHPELEINLALVPDGQALPEQVRLALFRIYQQTLNNVIRHAKATRVDIRLMMDAEQIILEVEDNGAGFELPGRWIELARKGHLGLVGSFERTQAIGGQMEVMSGPGKGTLVRVAVPYQSE